MHNRGFCMWESVISWRQYLAFPHKYYIHSQLQSTAVVSKYKGLYPLINKTEQSANGETRTYGRV